MVDYLHNLVLDGRSPTRTELVLPSSTVMSADDPVKKSLCLMSILCCCSQFVGKYINEFIFIAVSLFDIELCRTITGLRDIMCGTLRADGHVHNNTVIATY